MKLPRLDYGGSGTPLYFLHANGYPPACYRPLLTKLAEQYHVFAFIQRPLLPNTAPADLEDWTPLSDDLLETLDGEETPVICAGHSMGATVLLRAALRAPEKFRAIVLIDPVLFLPSVIFLWNSLRALGLAEKVHPLIRAARSRRRSFDDLERLYNSYRRKPIFRYLDDRALRACVEGMTCPSEGKYRLCYSPEWETRIYATNIGGDMDLWRGLPNLRPPALILRGAETNVFRKSAARRVQRLQPRLQLNTLEKSTHLLPFEQPEELAHRIFSFLKESL